jgi:hypothetical protein
MGIPVIDDVIYNTVIYLAFYGNTSIIIIFSQLSQLI